MERKLVAHWIGLIMSFDLCGCSSVDGRGSDRAADELMSQDDGGREVCESGNGESWLGNELKEPTTNRVSSQFAFDVPDRLVEHQALVYEASWYGNLFADDPVMYFCEGSGAGLDAAQRQNRTCSTGDGCGIINLGSCYIPGRCDKQQGARVGCKANGKVYNTLSTHLAIR